MLCVSESESGAGGRLSWSPAVRLEHSCIRTLLEETPAVMLFTTRNVHCTQLILQCTVCSVCLHQQ